MTIFLSSIVFLASTGSPTRRHRGRHPARHRGRHRSIIRTVVETTGSFTSVAADPGTVGCDIVRTGQTLVLRGELDLSARDVFSCAGDDFVAHCAAELNRLAAAGTSEQAAATFPATVVDVAELRFIDAAGLDVLVRLRDDLAAAGIQMRTLHPSYQFRRLSAICRLDDVLCMYPAGRPPAGAGAQT